jgi:hypothetical protein
VKKISRLWAVYFFGADVLVNEKKNSRIERPRNLKKLWAP